MAVFLLGAPLTANAQTEPTLENALKIANEVKLCSFATTDGDQPHVRIFQLMSADETGFYFSSQAYKDVYKQMGKNNKVALLFFDQKNMTQLRVTGEVKFIEDLETRTKILDQNPQMKQMLKLSGPEDPRWVIVHVYTGEFLIWTFQDMGKEPQLPRVKF